MGQRRKKTSTKPLRLATLGQFVAGSPDFRQAAEVARAELAEGLAEENVRERIRNWARAEKITGARAVLDGLATIPRTLPGQSSRNLTGLLPWSENLERGFPVRMPQRRVCRRT